MRLGAFLVDRRPLRIPAFRRLWTAWLVTGVGGSFSVVAVPTQLFSMTRSSATVGLAAAVSLVALVGSSLWSGALADAVDRRTRSDRCSRPTRPGCSWPASCRGPSAGSADTAR